MIMHLIYTYCAGCSIARSICVYTLSVKVRAILVPRNSGGRGERRCSDDKVVDGIAVITMGSARRIYFDEEMGDALTEALDRFAGDPNVRMVVVTGGAPGYFIRHFTVAALIRLAESLRASGREWPENATYNGGFFDKAMALCESMPKPVIAAISGTALAGGFEFALSCDLRIAEDGDYLIGLPEAHLGLLPGAGGTQRLPRAIGTPAALMHILMGDPLTPREAERKGLVHETVSGKALDRAMEIAQRLSHIRRNRLLTSSVSSAMPPRRRWHKVWHSNEISS